MIRHSRRWHALPTYISPYIYICMFYLLYILYRVYPFPTYSVLIFVSLIIRFDKTQYDCLFLYASSVFASLSSATPRDSIQLCLPIFFCLSFFPDSLSSSAQHFFLSMFICISSSPPVCLALQSTVQFIISIYICISFYLYLLISVCLLLQRTLLYNFVYLLLYVSLPIFSSPPVCLPLQSTLLYNFVYLLLYESLPPPVCLDPPPSFEYKLMTLIQEITI
jgi:hypothetical protein